MGVNSQPGTPLNCGSSTERCGVDAASATAPAAVIVSPRKDAARRHEGKPD
jgi:hypothetical protein